LIAQEHLVNATPEAAEAASSSVHSFGKIAWLCKFVASSCFVTQTHQGTSTWGADVAVTAAHTRAHTYRAYNKLLRHVNAPTLVGLRLETAPSDMDPPSWVRSP